GRSRADCSLGDHAASMCADATLPCVRRRCERVLARPDAAHDPARPAILDTDRRARGRSARAALDRMTAVPSAAASSPASYTADAARVRALQGLGMFCGFAAGAWLGAAEAPTKLVTIGLSPLVVSLMMVV